MDALKNKKLSDAQEFLDSFDASPSFPSERMIARKAAQKAQVVTLIASLEKAPESWWKAHQYDFESVGHLWSFRQDLVKELIG